MSSRAVISLLAFDHFADCGISAWTQLIAMCKAAEEILAELTRKAGKIHILIYYIYTYPKPTKNPAATRYKHTAISITLQAIKYFPDLDVILPLENREEKIGTSTWAEHSLFTALETPSTAALGKSMFFSGRAHQLQTGWFMLLFGDIDDMWYSVCVWLLICDLLCDICRTVNLILILGNQHAAPSWLLSWNKHSPPCAHRCKQMLPSPGYNFSTTLKFGEFHLPKNTLQQWLPTNTGYIVPAINSNSIYRPTPW